MGRRKDQGQLVAKELLKPTGAQHTVSCSISTCNSCIKIQNMLTEYNL